MSKIGTLIYLKHTEILLNTEFHKNKAFLLNVNLTCIKKVTCQFSQKKKGKNSCHISVIYTENTEPWKTEATEFYITQLICELITKVPRNEGPRP